MTRCPIVSRSLASLDNRPMLPSHTAILNDDVFILPGGKCAFLIKMVNMQDELLLNLAALMAIPKRLALRDDIWAEIIR